MAGPTLLAAKAALLLSDEQVRKRIGYAAASVFVPLVLVVAFLLSLLSGTTQHTKYGVVKTQLDQRSWTAWLEIPYISYD